MGDAVGDGVGAEEVGNGVGTGKGFWVGKAVGSGEGSDVGTATLGNEEGTWVDGPWLLTGDGGMVDNSVSEVGAGLEAEGL